MSLLRHDQMSQGALGFISLVTQSSCSLTGLRSCIYADRAYFDTFICYTMIEKKLSKMDVRRLELSSVSEQMSEFLFFPGSKLMDEI